MTWIAAYLLSGAFIGFLAGLLGIGGGMVLVPILSALFAAQAFAPGYVVHMALATGMASVMFTSLSSLREHHRLGSVDWEMIRRLVPAMMVGALAASFATGWISQRALAMAFAVITAGGATLMLRKAKPVVASRLPGPLVVWPWMAAIGAICGLMSAGGAFLTVPFMVYCGVPIRTAIGTGSALGWPVAVIGTIGYAISGWRVEQLPPYSMGFVFLPALLVIVLASVLLAPLGARLMHKVPIPTLKKGFVLLLYVLAAKMVVTYW